MTDTPDTGEVRQLTFGQRVQRARTRTGRTRAYVADVMGHSEEWVKAVERGTIAMPRLPKLLRLAQVLGVEDIAELTGDDRIAAASFTKAEHRQLPVVKDALNKPQLAAAARPAEPVEVLAARLRQAWKLWHAAERPAGRIESGEGNRTRIGRLLPALLADTRHAARTLEGADRRKALMAQAEAYHLAQLFLSFQPAPDLIMLTGDRAMTAAQDADSPRAIAAAAWYVNHVHRDAGEAAEARVELAEQAVALLPDTDDPECIARRGLLYLAVALSYAKTGQAGDAWRYWDKADAAARRLGDDYAHPWLIFGRGVVDGYAITMHNDLVQPGKALEVADAVNLRGIPSATRRSYHLIETARAHGLRNEGAAVVSYLQRAHRESPETIQFNLYTRSALPGLVTSGPQMVREDAEGLARELGVPV
ncbi:helix-turn-helix domain-containing protein [Streptomyces flavofungini]|uniref:helix-turn-helix domain-containing protein n=1 Tax=Streptomyces flavofungini TaxID=68200 RepID=UPI0025B24A64|nr:helix-turn-helix domain-containing protein [Streptomyces flavofungini]WJV47317.1 helix-turn-helix domain-containing protein [Streptomyces flavofungini]